MPRVRERCPAQLLGIEAIVAFLRIVLVLWKGILECLCRKVVAEAVLIIFELVMNRTCTYHVLQICCLRLFAVAWLAFHLQNQIQIKDYLSIDLDEINRN